MLAASFLEFEQMRVYHPGKTGKQTTFVQPGVHHPIADWMDEERKPKMFSVTFVDGCAEVPDNLGQYMLDRELAKASPIILLT